MRAIGRFLKDVFVLRPLDVFIAIGLVVVCMFIMVGPFFGFEAGNGKRDKKPRGSKDNLSTL